MHCQVIEYNLRRTHIITQKDMVFIRKKVFFIALSVIGLCIIYFGITPLNNSAKKNISPPPKSAEVIMLEKIEKKTSGKYDIGGHSISTHVDNNSKDIDIDILGSQEYYESVKNEIQDIVKSLTKSTEFEAYNVNVNKNETIQMMNEEELLERHSSINKIAKAIDKKLSTTHANQISGINMNVTPPDSPQVLTIEINTLLEGKKQGALGVEIRNIVYTMLEKELFSNKLVSESTIEIYIYNKHNEKIKTS